MSKVALVTHDVGWKTARVVALVAILAAAALCAAGCSTSSVPRAQNAFSGKQPATTNSKMASMAKNSTAAGMKCSECSGNGKAVPIEGGATVENGVQVIKISLKDGQYSPNQFTVQGSMPVKVSFEGTATGCLGHPTFKSLNTKADITTSPAALDLGTLKRGTYKFTCAMGMNSGTISVQ